MRNPQTLCLEWGLVSGEREQMQSRTGEEEKEDTTRKQKRRRWRLTLEDMARSLLKAWALSHCRALASTWLGSPSLLKVPTPLPFHLKPASRKWQHLHRCSFKALPRHLRLSRFGLQGWLCNGGICITRQGLSKLCSVSSSDSHLSLPASFPNVLPHSAS